MYLLHILVYCTGFSWFGVLLVKFLAVLFRVLSTSVKFDEFCLYSSLLFVFSPVRYSYIWDRWDLFVGLHFNSLFGFGIYIKKGLGGFWFSNGIFFFF